MKYLNIELASLSFLFILTCFASCSNKPTENKTNIGGNDTILADTNSILEKVEKIEHEEEKILKLEKTYKFEDFKVPVYFGKLAKLNFRNNPFSSDKEYVEFITNGCEKNKINFAGHYTIIERSCGMACLHLFIVDRKNGKIFTETTPDDGRYGYKYRKGSKLLIANSSLFIDENYEQYEEYWCKPEFYKWDKDDFILLK